MPIGASQKQFLFPVYSFPYSWCLLHIDIDLIELLNLADNHFCRTMISGPKYMTEPNLSKTISQILQALTSNTYIASYDENDLSKFYELENTCHISHKTKKYKIGLHLANSLHRVNCSFFRLDERRSGA
jgi:hypothetical protein